MKVKSVLVLLAVVLGSTVSFANTKLEEQLGSIDAKAKEIRSLMSNKEVYKSFQVNELRDLECTVYGKTRGVFEHNEGTTVFKDVSGSSFTDIKDYYYPSQISIYSLPTQTNAEQTVLLSLIIAGTNAQNAQRCALSVVKIGYRYVGEVACEGANEGADPSIYSPELSANQYIECALPGTMI